jgi:hypothetical protein
MQGQMYSMIDNREQAERLVTKLRESLPLPALLTPQLTALVRKEKPGMRVAPTCPITRVDYAGDEGGIMCRLEIGSEDESAVFYVSITHLAFDRRLPLAREIAAYQKHRIKRIRYINRAA